jgi:hypothetical protein
MSHRINLFSIIWLSLTLAGCGSPVASPPNRPPRLSNSEAQHGSWVTSDDGLLALRLSVKSQQVASNESIHAVAAIRNLSQQPITALRPFGDWYAAKAIGMKIWDAKQQIRYTGAQATYVIGGNAFAVIAPGESIEDQMELSIDNFAGLESPGSYTLRFDYSYHGQWDTTAAAGGSGISNAWRGTIGSREVEILRK